MRLGVGRQHATIVSKKNSNPKQTTFDPEKPTLHQKAKTFNKEISTWLKSSPKIDPVTRLRNRLSISNGEEL